MVINNWPVDGLTDGAGEGEITNYAGLFYQQSQYKSRLIKLQT
jgi:hypothetical protein